MRRRAPLYPSNAARAAFLPSLSLLLGVSLVLGGSLLTPPRASALSFDFQKVVASDDAATGLPAGTTFVQFFGVSLNGAGDIVFSTTVTGGGSGSGDDELIYRAPFAGALTPLVREGDAAPGAGTGVVYGSPGSAVQNDAGQIAFSPQIGDGSDSWGALFVPGGSGPTLFAREGDTIPGGGATWNSFTHLISPVIDASGGVAFQANLSGAGFGSSIWGPGAVGDPVLVAKEGEQAPGFAVGIEHDAVIFDPLLNDTGRLAFAGQLGGSGSGEDVLWLRDGVATPAALVQGTDASSALGVGESFGSLSLLELNDAGTVVFHSVVDGPLVTASNDGALWRADGSGDPTLLVREGDAAPGAAGGTTFSGLLSGRLAENGTLAFAADLSDTLGGSSRALYLIDETDTLDLILETGDAAPDLAGLVIADLPFDPLIDDEGNTAFRATLACPDPPGSCSVDAGNDMALFYYDALHDEIVLVAREGDTIELAPGDTRTIGALFAPDLNDASQMSLFVSFVGGGQGIFLAAIPEPGTAALVAMGCAGLAASRRRATRRCRS